MAYLALSPETGPCLSPNALTGPAATSEPAARFSALEWNVVALARRDRLSSLRAPGRLSVALAALFGGRTNSPLADARLESLRRLAVLTWHHGYQVPASAIRDFLDHGFTGDHYGLLAASIGIAQTRGRSDRADAA